MPLAENWDEIVKAITALSWMQAQQSYVEVQNKISDYIVASIDALSTIDPKPDTDISNDTLKKPRPFSS